MTQRRRGELPPLEESLLPEGSIVSPEDEAAEAERYAERVQMRKTWLTIRMQDPAFRVWFMEILLGFGTFSNAFGAGPSGHPDPMATQFQLGQKAAGWHLWCMVDEACPDLASLMRREQATAR